ncbi:hypothetical protein NL676_004770 [Syzygium grande]|nr:hypothetical protein NL676_004770 [Syzygium grande]
MSLSKSQTQNGKRSRDTSEVFDPEVFDRVFRFLMNFANDAETIVRPPKHRVREEEPLENNAGEMFGKLPARAKEEVLLKDLFGEIVGNVLNKLPEEGKEEFLVKCFVELLPKLSHESRTSIEIKVKGTFSSSQEAPDTLSGPEIRLPTPNPFPDEYLHPVPFIVTFPTAVGGGGNDKGTGKDGDSGQDKGGTS